MKLVFNKHNLEVIREPSDPKYYGLKNAAGESNLLYAIKNAMIKLGWKVIKKRMWKDGHLVDDMQQYLRTRNGSDCWYNDHWAICGLDEDFNAGKAVLRHC